MRPWTVAFRSGPGSGWLCGPCLCGAPGSRPGTQRGGGWWSVPVARATPARCARGRGHGLGLTALSSSRMSRRDPGPALRCGRTSPSLGSEAGRRRTSVALSPLRSGQGLRLSVWSHVTSVPGDHTQGQPWGTLEPVWGGAQLAHWPQCPPRTSCTPVHPGCHFIRRGSHSRAGRAHASGRVA